jgi:anti-anti-sigma regulatory factor
VQFETSELDSIRVLKITGHVAPTDAPKLMAALERLSQAPRARCVLYTAGLRNLPTAVISAVLNLVRRLEQSGGRLVMAAPEASLRSHLDRLGIASMLGTAGSLDEAVEVLRRELTDTEEA